MRIHGRAALAACLLCAALQARAAAVIRSVQVTPAGDSTQITFEADKTLHYQLMTLHHPDRLVLQLEPIRSTRPFAVLRHALDADTSLIRSIRIGQYTPEAVRLVLELKRPVKPVVMAQDRRSRDAHRLIMKIVPAGKDALAALVQEEEAQLKTAEARQAEQKKLRLAARHRPVHPAPAVPRRAHPVIVAIDAGHGGQDPGARGPDGLYEKQVTLAIARKLKARLDELPGLHGVLVRDGDYFIPLHQRIVKARRMHADLFISIHADSSDSSHAAQGSSVYALSERGATSVAARMLARQENDADRIGGISLPTKDLYLAKTLLDLSQTATINDSLKLGNLVLRQLGDFKPLHNQRVEQAGFAVLKSPEMPSILIETDFINNPAEAHKLANSEFQERLARAIASGVQQYLGQVADRRRLTAADDTMAGDRRQGGVTD